VTVWSPLRLEPILKPRVWGGTRLRDAFGKAYPTDEPYGESWEITWRGADTNRIAAGPNVAKTLEAVAQSDRTGFVGSRLAGLPAFPLLAKLLDCEQRLSVQVHPTPAYAAQHPDAEVKMEAWVILDAPPGAEIIFGLAPGMTRETFSAAVKQGTLEATLKRRKVKKGDVLLVVPGTVHALLEGLLVYEIQQSSDTTYRVYDWDRVGIDGKPRELHVQQALDCIAFGADAPTESPSPLRLDDDREVLVATSAFALERVRVNGSVERRLDGTHCELLTVVDGSGDVELAGAASRGDSFFVPAASGEYAMDGEMTVLIAYVPDLEAEIMAPARAAGCTDREIRAVCGG